MKVSVMHGGLYRFAEWRHMDTRLLFLVAAVLAAPQLHL